VKIIAELKRRNVFRVAVAYAVVGWLLVEVSSVVLPIFEAPAWTLKVVTFLILVGFPVALVFAWAFELTSEGLKLEHEVDREQSITHLTGRKLDFSIIGFLALAVVFLVVDNYVLVDEQAVDATNEREEQQSIAVLPFVNMSANVENEYLSDGIAEELLNLLVRLPSLRVSSRTSSFAFKGKDIDIPTVARVLDVKNVLDGSVRRSGERIRITAQLIDTETDSHLWSETYDRELDDIFAVQDDIARSIAEALKVTLAPEDAQALESVRTANVKAYESYLRGRSYLIRTTGDDTRKAMEMFRQAIEGDPNFAPAYAWLANAHIMMFRAWDSDPEHLAQADALGRTALELAPDSDVGHIALGFSLTMEERYEEAERELDAALRLNPRSADAHWYAGVAAYHQGKTERAAELWERATGLDPDEFRIWQVLPQVYRSLGRFEDELAASRQLEVVARRRLEINPDDLQTLLALSTAQLVLSKTDKAIELADRVLALAGDDAAILYNAACVYSRAGATDTAIAVLEKSFDAGLADPSWMEQDSDLDKVRDDPRFIALVERMKAGLLAAEERGQ